MTNLSPRRPPVHVTTFYSFKGGVGRSMLLANTGWLLSERRRVLLWDLDIEAPGLHRIPALRPAAVPRGFFEWLEAWQGAEEVLRTGELAPADAASLERLVQRVPGRPLLSILPAFGENADPARLYAEGPWRRLFFEEPALGLALMDAVVAVLGRERDHLLIDSRTGFTDVGGFLAALVPHATVLVGGYGEQNVFGLGLVKRALEGSERLEPRKRLDPGAELQLLHVVSPVPRDLEISSERRRVWEEAFGAVQPVEVPFDQRLLWSEELLAATDAESDTARAYRRVAERLAGLRERLLADLEAETTEERRRPERFDLAEPGQRARKGPDFEARVKRLLELHGYTVEPKQILDGNEVDLVARFASGLDEQLWWVECKDHRRPVGKDVLEKMVAWVGGREGRSANARAMVVARSFTAAAVSFAKDRPDLRAWTLEDLERRLFDPAPYLNGLVSSFEQGPLARTYVPQWVLLEKPRGREARVELLEHAVSWAGGEGPRLWLLLGDYGTGKSTFFRRFAYELARRALADPELPFPIAVDLRDFPNATSAETLLFEHLRKVLPREARIDPSALLHLLAAGRCVLLLDSFDEMGVAAAGRSVEEQFRELARLAGEEAAEGGRGSRVLLTCRTHFFRDQQQVKDAAAGRLAGLSPAADSALGKVARRFNAEIDELDIFDGEQIRQFLEHHLGKADAARAEEFIERTYDLPRLAPRPVLLELIVKSLPTLWQEGSEKAVTPAGLYEVYTRRWLEDRSGRSLQTTPVERHRLLTLLAASLWRREDRQLHHRDLLAEVESLSAHFPGLDFDRVDVELRTAAFLVRSAEGFYRFSHKSFLEYFLARGLWDALASPETAAAALALPPLTPEVGQFFWQLPEDGREVREETLRALLRAPYRALVSENALRLGAWKVPAQPAFSAEGAQLAGAQLKGVRLDGIVLRRADLNSADLRRAVLSRVDLRGSSLDRTIALDAELIEVDLAGASLVEADLYAAVLERVDFSQASLIRAKLTAASGDRIIFEGADLSFARLSDSTWTDTNFQAANLDEAQTSDWLLAGETGLNTSIFASHPEDLEVQVEWEGGALGDWACLAFSPDGLFLAASQLDAVQIWNLRTGEVDQVLFAPQALVTAVAYSPDGRYLAAGYEDSSACVWAIGQDEQPRVLRGRRGPVLALSFSPDGCSLLLVVADGTAWLLDWSQGVERWIAGGRGAGVSAAALCRERQWVAVGGHDGLVVVWDVTSRREIEAFAGSGGRVLALAFSQDGSLLARGSADGSIQVWTISQGFAQRASFLLEGRVFSLAFSLDGTLLAAVGENGAVQMWEVSSQRPLPFFSSMPATEVRVENSVLEAGHLQLHVHRQLGTGDETVEVHGPMRPIYSLVFSPDGRTLAFAGFGIGGVRLWDLESGSQRATFSSWGEHAITTIPSGWYVHSPRDEELPSRALRLLVAEPGAGPDRNYRILPFAGLARWLEQPERVRAALAKPIESRRRP